MNKFSPQLFLDKLNVFARVCNMISCLQYDLQYDMQAGKFSSAIIVLQTNNMTFREIID